MEEEIPDHLIEWCKNEAKDGSSGDNNPKDSDKDDSNETAVNSLFYFDFNRMLFLGLKIIGDGKFYDYPFSASITLPPKL